MRVEKRKKWVIWTLGEADIDVVAEGIGVNLSRDEKEEVARLYRKGFEAANADWCGGLEDAIAEVKKGR